MSTTNPIQHQKLSQSKRPLLTGVALLYLLLTIAATSFILANNVLPRLRPNFSWALTVNQQNTNSAGLDLRTWKPAEQGIVELSHGWRFFPGILSNDLPQGGVPLVQVPRSWSGYSQQLGLTLTPYGTATYHLPLRLSGTSGPLALRLGRIASAAEIYWDGQLLARIGNLGSSREGSNPEFRPTVLLLPPSGPLNTQHDLIIQVSNFHDSSGGLVDPIFLGSPAQAYGNYWLSLLGSALLVGIFLMMGLYHLFLFLYRKQDSPAFMFALLCGLLTIRILVSDDLPIRELLPQLGYSWLTKINYLTYTFLVPPFTHFLSRLFDYRFSKQVTLVSVVVSLLYSGLIILAPIWVYDSFLLPYQIFTVILALFLIGRLVLAIFRGEDHALLMGLGFLVVVGTMILDIFKANALLYLPSFVPIGILVFVFCQSLALISRSTRAMTQTEELSFHLQKVNSAMQRFVPREFLTYLNRENITQVQLGDHSEQTMTIMFADIKKFTSLSETMSPEEVFDTLNGFLAWVVPIIREHRGFVDKYLGDGVMALFPADPGQAIDAAVEIQVKSAEFNNERANRSLPAIEMGIGIHQGPVMLGTIGEESRMDGTVVADAVNLASRLQDMTRILGCELIVSGTVVNNLKLPENYHIRRLGSVPLRGKKQQVELFEIYDGNPPQVFRAKRKHHKDFERAVYFISEGRFGEAAELLATIPKEAAEADPGLKYYLNMLHQK